LSISEARLLLLKALLRASVTDVFLVMKVGLCSSLLALVDWACWCCGEVRRGVREEAEGVVGDGTGYWK